MSKIESTFKNKLGASIIDNATEGIIVANNKGLIVYANEIAHKMFEYDEGHLLGISIDELVPKEIKAGHENLRNSFNKNPVHKPMGVGRDLNGRKKTGKTFPVEISLSPVKVDEENFVTALITDISLRKILQDKVIRLNETLESRVQEKIKEVRRSQKLYDAVARNYPNGTISVVDENLSYIMVEGRELFELNITSDTLRGNSYLDQIPEIVRGEVENRLRLALLGENQDFELNYGSEFYRIDAVPIDSIGEEGKTVLVVEQNITAIRKALDKERELNELKSRFVSMASHEFRTPLSTISSSSDLADQYFNRGNSEKASKHLIRIRESVKHMVSILDDYLSLEKFEGGSWNDKFETIDLKDLFLGVVEDQKIIIKPDQKIEFTYRVSAKSKNVSLPIAVKGIAMNLISNASKYSEDGSKIKVDFSDNNDSWILKVQDEGIGIRKEEVSLIFKQFFRSDRTSHIPGTGVGLDLVQRYVKALGGEISLSSVVGDGSTFTAVWPKKKEIIKSW